MSKINVIQFKDYNTSLFETKDLFTNEKLKEFEHKIRKCFENKELYKFIGNYIKNGKTDKQEALWFGPVDYKYGKYKPLKSYKMPDFIKEIAVEIENKIGYDKNFLNSVYVNHYKNGGIGRHHDNDNIFKKNKDWESGTEIIVAVFSIGGDSKITITDKKNNIIDFIIAKNNSLYTMNRNFQNNLFHEVGISKGERFSFTFRHSYID